MCMSSSTSDIVLQAKSLLLNEDYNWIVFLEKLKKFISFHKIKDSFTERYRNKIFKFLDKMKDQKTILCASIFVPSQPVMSLRVETREAIYYFVYGLDGKITIDEKINKREHEY